MLGFFPSELVKRSHSQYLLKVESIHFHHVVMPHNFISIDFATPQSSFCVGSRVDERDLAPGSKASFEASGAVGQSAFFLLFVPVG